MKNGRVCRGRVSLLLHKDQSMYSGLVAGEAETCFLQSLAGCLSGRGIFAGEKTSGTTRNSSTFILRCFDGGGGEVYVTGGSWWSFPLGVVISSAGQKSGDSNIGMGLPLPFSDTTSSCLAGFLSGSGGGVSGGTWWQICVSIRHTREIERKRFDRSRARERGSRSRSPVRIPSSIYTRSNTRTLRVLYAYKTRLVRVHYVFYTHTLRV